MSQIKVNEIYDASGGSTAKLYGPSMRYGGTAFVNRIINGDMRIDQRNDGASVTLTSSLSYYVDRFRSKIDGANGTIQKVTSSLSNFPLMLRIQGSSGSTIAYCIQDIESVHCQDLQSQYVTVSLTAASSSTITLYARLRTPSVVDNFSSTLTTVASTSIALTASLTNYTMTFGPLPASVANGLRLEFYTSSLGANTLDITGVQLEAGTVASPFERRDYGRELMMCQRYYEILSPAYVMFPWGSASQLVRTSQGFRVTKRAAPTVLMGAKATGTGTMGASGVTVGGVTYFGSGSFQDVVGYDTPTAEIEL